MILTSLKVSGNHVKIELACKIYQNLFLSVIQRSLNAGKAKLNSTKLKVLHCKISLEKVFYNKKLCKVKIRIKKGSLLGASTSSTIRDAFCNPLPY